MQMNKKRIARGVALAVLSAAGAQALAQSSGLEEIVVTAQKREQSLQEAPIAISAFGAEALKQQRIQDVHDISGFVPNLQINLSPGGSTGATVAIRGSVTANPAVTWEPTVGMYLDGAFIGKNLGGIFDVADLERVEVLRGPQGSLYGKNTVGGAINLITRKPSGEFGGQLLGGFGSESYYRYRGSLDTPALGTVGEGLGRFAANITAQREKRDGFVDNVNDPVGMPFAAPASSDEYQNLDSTSGRVALALDVTEDFEVRYSYDFSNKDQNPTASVLTNVDPSMAVGAFAPAAAALPLLQPYVQSDDEYPSKLSNDQSRFEKSDIDGHALQLRYGLGDMGMLGDVTLKSITSYRQMQWDDWLDLDGSPIDFFHSARYVDYDQFSQELQVVGATERVNYVLGLYYFTESADVYNPIWFFGVFGAPPSPNAYNLNGTSQAVFGQIDWKPAAEVLKDRLTVTLGARYTEEDKNQEISHPATPFWGNEDDNWNNFSPALTLTWELTEAMNVYARYAEGWKSGGFNGEADTLASFQRAYDPEEVSSYELGLKSRWLDDRLQLNAAAFENKIDDMQISVFLSGSAAASVVDNAGKATIKGFELEVLAMPVENLQLNLNWGYLDTEYDEYIDAGVDVADSRDFPYSPENTASAGIQYTVPGVLGGELVGRLDWIYVDDRVAYPDPVQNLYGQLDSYSLLNGRVTLADIPVGEGTLEVAAWGKNLTDEEYRINTIPFLIWTVSYFGDPRTYGLEVSYDF